MAKGKKSKTALDALSEKEEQLPEGVVVAKLNEEETSLQGIEASVFVHDEVNWDGLSLEQKTEVQYASLSGMLSDMLKEETGESQKNLQSSLMHLNASLRAWARFQAKTSMALTEEKEEE